MRPHSSTMSSERANIASVSVGKPAMRSAPKTMSGRRRAHLGAEADRVGAQMAALHALQDEVVAGLQREVQMRHQPRLRRRSRRAGRRSASTESIEERRSRSSSGTCAQDRLDQRAERRRARQVAAVARDVDAGQHDLARAVLDEAAAPARPRRPSARERELPRPIRDDAEGAAVVAAVLHLHEGAGAAARCRR